MNGKSKSSTIFFGLYCLAAGLTPGAVSAQEVNYFRAEQLLTWNASLKISGDQVNPQWMADGNQFWYRNKTGSGYEFVLLDPVRSSQGPLFNHYRLAASMSLANDTTYQPEKLPFSSFHFLRNETAIEFNASKKRFDCDIRTYECTVLDTLPDNRPFVLSPDSLWEAFAHEYDLYIRPKGGGDSIQLSFDGEEYFAYGLTAPRPNQIKRKTPQRPNVRWSPDSKRIAVMRTDERNVELMHYISYTSQRPKHYSRPYALPTR